jgi:hypothetical protein
LAGPDTERLRAVSNHIWLTVVEASVRFLTLMSDFLAVVQAGISDRCQVGVVRRRRQSR